jgi:hypothetical protein
LRGRLGNALKGHFSRGTTVPVFTVFMDPSPIEDSSIRGTKIPYFAGEARVFMKTINPAFSLKNKYVRYLRKNLF